jgi:hypothetical protein
VDKKVSIVQLLKLAQCKTLILLARSFLRTLSAKDLVFGVAGKGSVIPDKAAANRTRQPTHNIERCVKSASKLWIIVLNLIDDIIAQLAQTLHMLLSVCANEGCKLPVLQFPYSLQKLLNGGPERRLNGGSNCNISIT